MNFDFLRPRPFLPVSYCCQLLPLTGTSLPRPWSWPKWSQVPEWWSIETSPSRRERPMQYRLDRFKTLPESVLPRRGCETLYQSRNRYWWHAQLGHKRIPYSLHGDRSDVQHLGFSRGCSPTRIYRLAVTWRGFLDSSPKGRRPWLDSNPRSW